MLMKFDVLYIDPPWQYKIYSKKGLGRSAENYYKTMNIDDICNLDINSIASDNSILFLWVTFPCLIEGIKAMESWGFKYKTIGFNWVKTNKIKVDSWFWGLGFWTRANSEICLIATKGNPKRISKSVHSIVSSPIENHSKKPNIVRERIEELMGDNVKRIEIFAREKYDGWVSIGNEIDGLDIRDAIEELKLKEQCI